MSDWLVSLFMGAGVAAFTYSKMGRRIGYSNGQNVWALVGITFVLVFIVVLTLLEFVLHIG